jgi:hypothetical protein
MSEFNIVNELMNDKGWYKAARASKKNCNIKKGLFKPFSGTAVLNGL